VAQLRQLLAEVPPLQQLEHDLLAVMCRRLGYNDGPIETLDSLPA
jgi:hypothetical protein